MSALESAARIAAAGALSNSARARLVLARVLDRQAELYRDNTLLAKCIAAYQHVLDMSRHLSDSQLRTVADRTLDRMNFRGNQKYM